ncbi:NHL repeat-containing protein [Rhodopirellula europaea]|jgi:sugar lactone lactonase YvrE|uniref:NHL repeat containing protein n=1 Tax=Rhodopirellula europaea SH398 TaxID=1263868 RepID=M5S928_9BACT|nr:NHL repeat-containing protein [Rhodopirellula europaea]EMI24162.1 NHL repeat containing protein [Rhodopirellula europaea SH398]
MREPSQINLAESKPIDRRQACQRLVAGATSLMGLASLNGCVASAFGGTPELVWGRRGFSDGRFLKPRAMAIDPDDQLYIVDTTGRIQVFDADGQHLRTWTTPETNNGRPTGMVFDGAKDRLLVADTHYYRMLAFTPTGELLPEDQIGGTSGSGAGEFAFVTDIAVDGDGCLYIGEYGASDRIQRFDPDGTFMSQWGGTGREVQHFVRPQSLVIHEQTLWIADACNHRVQRYDISTTEPQWIGSWGQEGKELGEFYYPYGIAVDPDGTVLVCEFGNQRVQCLTPEGEPVSSWGAPGHDPGQLYEPWGLVVDSQRRVHVLDSNNHRVQRFTLPG